MSLDGRGAKITRRDVSELGIASEQLAVAADTIRRMRPSWGEAVVNLLIAANLTITRVQNKGAASFARYLQKHGLQKPEDAPDPGATGNEAPEPPSAAPDQE